MSPSRKAVVEVTVLAALAVSVVILVLNLLEVDDYPEALDPAAAVTPDPLPSWLSPELKHGCDACATCIHRFETSECRIVATVRDRDGWHRLFWAGSETYTYDDPAFLGGALRNRTAELVGGTWTIRGRYTPAENHPPHACSPAAREVDLRYRLHRGRFPGTGDPALDPSGTLAVPGRLLWFRFSFPPDRVDDFWWELENPDTFAGASMIPCSCGPPDPGQK